ncbi:hypothetical protein FOB72_15295 [Cupriavidus pauculus]|uniref:Uncharacterized protein n=1 Tax=Cupriavidus pauculus TaxID=82633 RepID=A0A5P2H5J5_9BURK|nr:hypothetical protein [Cupriavidus pauculus]QET03282.1 hypothetical protein FOB72_15295 [Cupriavidus pauculus]
MLRWVAKGLLLLILGGTTVAVVVRVHRSAGDAGTVPDAAPAPADASGLPPIQAPAAPGAVAGAAVGNRRGDSGGDAGGDAGGNPDGNPGSDAGGLADLQAVGHALMTATHPAERGALLARLDPIRLRAVRQYLTRNPPVFDGPRHHVAVFDAERYGNWLTARADVDAHLRNGAMIEVLADYLQQSSRDATLDTRAIATLATLPDAVEVAEVLIARGQRAAVEARLHALEHGAAGDEGTLDTVEQARLALMIAADDLETTTNVD